MSTATLTPATSKQLGYQSFTAGKFRFERDEYFAHIHYPGGRHVMLELSSRTPAVGDSVPLTLHLARGGELTIRVPVRAYGDSP